MRLGFSRFSATNMCIVKNQEMKKQRIRKKRKTEERRRKKRRERKEEKEKKKFRPRKILKYQPEYGMNKKIKSKTKN